MNTEIKEVTFLKIKQCTIFFWVLCFSTTGTTKLDWVIRNYC